MDFGFGFFLAREEKKNRPSYFFLMSQETGYVLDVDQQKNLRLTKQNTSTTQKWEYTKEGFLKNAGHGLVLDIKNANYSENAELILYKENWGKNQQWDLHLSDGVIQSRMDGRFLTSLPGKPLKIGLTSKCEDSSQFWNVLQEHSEID
jgi:hypothetical protein